MNSQIMNGENKKPRRRDFVTLRGRQNKKKEEKCPLCEISEETLKRLKEAGKREKTGKKPEKNNEK